MNEDKWAKCCQILLYDIIIIFSEQQTPLQEQSRLWHSRNTPLRKVFDVLGFLEDSLYTALSSDISITHGAKLASLLEAYQT